MKRPMTLVLVATLLASGSAFAAANPKMTQRVAAQVVRNDNDRGNDRRNDHGNDRLNDQRNNDHRGNDNRGHDNGGRPPVDHRNDNDRRDWNDHRNDNNRRDNDRHDWNDHRNDRNDNRGWDRPRNDWANHPNYWDNRRHDRRDYARYQYNYGHYRAPRGYHYRVWHRGDYLPRAYYGSSYIIHDWRPYRLYAPPYGYHWVRVGDDVLLTALATGVVLDVLYDIWY